MIRWLEANGYDVSYSTGVDSDRRGAEITEHRIFLSVGHDEYWSGNQRANVEAARAAGIHLAFFSGNESFWKTRWENSISTPATPYRTLVTYKETHANAKIDPTPVWTGTWRDKRFSPPADGGRPENALTGTIFTVNCCADLALRISEAEGKLRFWRHTSVANLNPGQTATVAPGILGYEFDEDLNNGSRPPGMMRLSTSTYNVDSYLLDNGSPYGPRNGHACADVVSTQQRGARVRRRDDPMVLGARREPRRRFGDAWHSAESPTNHSTSDGEPARGHGCSTADAAARARPRHRLERQHGAHDDDLVARSGRPFCVRGLPVNITGTASDIDGIVSAVEVSVDGGATWQRAIGKTSWTYSWTPGSTRNVTIAGSCHR